MDLLTARVIHYRFCLVWRKHHLIESPSRLSDSVKLMRIVAGRCIEISSHQPPCRWTTGKLNRSIVPGSDAERYRYRIDYFKTFEKRLLCCCWTQHNILRQIVVILAEYTKGMERQPNMSNCHVINLFVPDSILW